MRVSRSGTSKLKIPEIFKICWPASEPCKQGTTRVKVSIFSMRPLRTTTYPLCKWEGISMHRLATLVCQIWGKYRWNMEIPGQNVLFWRGSIKRLNLQTTYRCRAEIFRIYFYVSATILCSYNVWPYAGQSQRDVKVENSWNLKNIFTCFGAL